MLCLDDGAVGGVKKQHVAVGISDVVIGGGAWIGRIHVRVWIGHGVFAAVHEDAGISHVLCVGVGD